MYLVGKIVSTHGIKGEVKVKSDTSFDRFKVGNVLYVNKNEKITINTHRVHNGFDLITFNNHNNINEILSYVGSELYTTHSKEELEEGRYYYEDLIGLDAYDRNDQFIGKVSDIRELPQGILLEIKTEKKLILIPYIDEFIKEVSLEEKKISILDIEGLL